MVKVKDWSSSIGAQSTLWAGAELFKWLESLLGFFDFLGLLGSRSSSLTWRGSEFFTAEVIY